MLAPVQALATVGLGANLVFTDAFTVKCLMICRIRLVQVMATKGRKTRKAKAAVVMAGSKREFRSSLRGGEACPGVDGSANDRRELGSQSTRCGASRDGTSMLPPTGPGEGVCGGRVSVGGDLEPSASYTCHVGVVSSAVAKAGPRGDDVLVVSSPWGPQDGWVEIFCYYPSDGDVVEEAGERKESPEGRRGGEREGQNEVVQRSLAWDFGCREGGREYAVVQEFMVNYQRQYRFWVLNYWQEMGGGRGVGDTSMCVHPMVSLSSVHSPLLPPAAAMADSRPLSGGDEDRGTSLSSAKMHALPRRRCSSSPFTNCTCTHSGLFPMLGFFLSPNNLLRGFRI
ncbi:hypothetical protein B296_00050728 [Ensete ventricosum]|uniref:Uncharacterized protein n=1 Tax=Ensete ventricosum TaxID=4639 RepID=A0A426YAS6_ENSVE|nr:hypothetical protein B296_00050728 [Ensete ventricosum]